VSTGNDDLQAWRRERTVTLAFELADSGRHEDFTDIAYALQFEHGLSASPLIDDADMRRKLNQRCGIARDALEPVEPPKPLAVVAQEAAAAEPPLPEPPPSLLRRAAASLWRSGSRAIKPVNAGELNSAPS
jgi:hypothetical protein